jgi:dipeptidyl aminopeptidase/acylaminoacyl peptidase
MSGRRQSRTRTAAVLASSIVLAAALTATACSGTLTKATPASPAVSAPAAGTAAAPLPAPTLAGTLAFARVGADSSDICVVHSDGTGLRALSKGPGWRDHPSWSPDGSRIAYVVYAVCRPTRASGGSDVGMPDEALRVMDADGSFKRQLMKAAVGIQPSWSPDGKHIVFSEFQSWGGYFVLLESYADGMTGSGSLVTHDANDVCPAWAPNGEVFFLRIQADEADVFRTTVPMHPMHPSGPETRVTRSGGVGAFALSRDGTQLLIHDMRHDRLVRQPARPGGTAVVLVDNVSQYVGSARVAAAWSPDGRAIAFAASGFGRPPGSALYIVDADGSGLSVVPDTGPVWDPDWRPD